MKKSVCLYFKIHIPRLLRNYFANEVDRCHHYEDETATENLVNKLSDECYLPANKIILSAIRKTDKKFKISFSFSGTALDLLQQYRPDVIRSFNEIAATGSAEILGETYYHSLSSLYSAEEFSRQLRKHTLLVKKIFGITPRFFRNTELIHNNHIAKQVKKSGFIGMLCEGINRLLKGDTPNKIFSAPGIPEFVLLLRNPVLSDDIAFRFDDVNWSEHPLTAEKFAEWIHRHPANTEIINLFIDYETFGVHKKATTGIFEFLQNLPEEILKNEGFGFSTPSLVAEEYTAATEYNVPETVSWEDQSAATCIWSGNAQQNNTIKKMYSLEKIVLKSNDAQVLENWGRLQAADYIFHMSGESVKYTNPFASTEAAYESYRNIVADFEISIIRQQLKKNKLNYIPHKTLIDF